MQLVESASAHEYILDGNYVVDILDRRTPDMRGTQEPKRTRPVIRRPPRKIALREVILSIGLVLAIIGAVTAGGAFLWYKTGRPEHISHDFDGTRYIPESPPGDPGAKAGIVVGLITVIVGLLLLVSAVVAGYIVKFRRTPIEDSVPKE